MEIYKENKNYFIERGFIPQIAEKVLRIASLSVWDAFWIFDEAKRIPEHGIYLEIGSHLGGSLLSAYLGTLLCRRVVNFIAIENNPTMDLLINTRQIPYLEIINLDSELAKNQIDDNSVDVLFIDADHHYQFVKMDINNYWPKVKPGGILFGHDYNRFDDVKRAVTEIFHTARIDLLPNSDIWKVQK